MYEGKALGEAIEKAITIKGITKKKLAEDFGIKPPSVNGWVSTGRISKTNLNKLVDYFSDVVPPEHFGIKSRSGLESNVSKVGDLVLWGTGEELDQEDYVYTPYYKDVTLAAGCGSFEGVDYNGLRLPFARSTLRKYNVLPEDAVCLSVSGNSMEPVLPDGSTVGVNTGYKQIKDGSIYAINHGGLLRIKLLYRLPNNEVRISSYNSAEYEDDVVPLTDVEILGKVFTWSVMVR